MADADVGQPSQLQRQPSLTLQRSLWPCWGEKGVHDSVQESEEYRSTNRGSRLEMIRGNGSNIDQTAMSLSVWI